MTPLSSQTVAVCDKVKTVSKEYPELEERNFDINLKEIYTNLVNLDYSKVVWRNVIIFIVLHYYAFGGLCCWIAGTPYWQTVALNFFYGMSAGLGITMGAHRLWAHKTYKAKLPLRIMLAFGQTVAIQNDIWEWCRDHRVHHKFSETDADPHNAMRGLFFSHMGWLMYKKHPDVKNKGKTVELDDLLEDPVVYYQKKFYIPLVLFFSVFLPIYVPMYFWNEVFSTAFMALSVRYTINLHLTWFVNSLAHWVGSKPYDRHIYPVENKIVAVLALGEGWHNYHHVFPFDYRTSELGGHLGMNFTAAVIDFCAKIGWVYDRKTASKEMVLKRKGRTGDGSQNEFLDHKHE